MSKLKVVTIVGTRPEIIRLSRLIPRLDEFTEHVLVHTGQNYDRLLNEVFFEDLELRQPDYYLNVDTSSMGAVMGDTMRKAEEVFLREKPDAVMILGDTNSAIAAVVAERMHIPVYHMEAGNRSFDNNVPEELNRKMVDHVASFNLPYNDFSMGNLLAEGLNPKFIHKTGSPMLEIFSHYSKKIEQSSILSDLGLKPHGYFLVSLHRQENVDSRDKLDQAIKMLKSVHEEWNLPVLMSTHPRTRSRLEVFSALQNSEIEFHEPFGYLDYNKLQMNAKCVISDSGTVSEEAAIMGFPALSPRNSTERVESLTMPGFGVVPIGSEQVIPALHRIMASKRDPAQPLAHGYEINNFSERVLNIMFSTVSQHRKWLNLD